MKKNITYKYFIDKLKTINFHEKRMSDSHLILFNQEFDATIVIPLKNKREIVPIYLLKTTQKTILEKGILSLEDFENVFFK